MSLCVCVCGHYYTAIEIGMHGASCLRRYVRMYVQMTYLASSWKGEGKIRHTLDLFGFGAKDPTVKSTVAVGTG